MRDNEETRQDVKNRSLSGRSLDNFDVDIADNKIYHDDGDDFDVDITGKRVNNGGPRNKDKPWLG